MLHHVNGQLINAGWIIVAAYVMAATYAFIAGKYHSENNHLKKRELVAATEAIKLGDQCNNLLLQNAKLKTQRDHYAKQLGITLTDKDTTIETPHANLKEILTSTLSK